MIDWQRIWNDDDAFRRFSPTRGILFLLSVPYRLMIFLRNRLYERQMLQTFRLSCPVISVGNITVGGTGKTPCVIYLAKMLQRRGFHPAVLSRGYGGNSKDPVNIVSDGTSILLGAEVAGDEPLLIAQSAPDVPVLTGPRRELTGKAAIERFGADVLICDDAFQHRRLCRDIDVVLMDGRKPLGNGRLLPRGELREPASSLKRASCVILTRMDQAHPADERVLQVTRASNIPVFRALHRFSDLAAADGRRFPPEVLEGKNICAFCGIAKPLSFQKMLLDLHPKSLSFNDYPDHHAFTRRDVEELQTKYVSMGADYLVTTEKDAMRLAAYPGFLERLYVMRMDMEISPPEPFEHFIGERLDTLVPGGWA